MPFKSKLQQRWMYANKPQMAERWSAHTQSHKLLPEKAKKKKKRKEKKAALIALRKTAAMFPSPYTPHGGFEEWKPKINENGLLSKSRCILRYISRNS